MKPPFRKNDVLFLISLLVWAWSFAEGQSLAITGSAIDVDLHGTITVLDRQSSMLRQYASDGRLLREIGGQGWGNDQFDHPSAVWAKNGIDVFVADYGNHRIQRFDNTLAYVSTLSMRESNVAEDRFGYPTGVALSRMGELFLVDGENARVVKFGATNTMERSFGGFNAGTGRLREPRMLACLANDNVAVLDPPRIMIYDAFGNFVEEVGRGYIQAPRAIASDQDFIVVLDSAGVSVLGRGGVFLGHVDIAGADEFDACAIENDTLYLVGQKGTTVTHGVSEAAAAALEKKLKAR